MITAHPGQPPQPHDLWTVWTPDPLLCAGLLLAAWVYRTGRARGRRSGGAYRDPCFAAGLFTLGVALLSPLDTMSGALASAHMVQHLLLMLVAAPLIALAAPGATLLRGSPATVRRSVGRWRRRLRLTRHTTGFLRLPAAVWLVHVGTLWFWHAAVPYGAALEHEVLHVLEHATFLLGATLFWGVIAGIWRTGRPSPGVGVVLVFATAMQSVFLSALLTFAGTPWYRGYTRTAPDWGMEPLADQQLAGVVMWIPAGMVYVVTALLLLVTWIRRSEAALPATSPARAPSRLDRPGPRVARLPTASGAGPSPEPAPSEPAS